jgi:hypothetical protein
MALNERTDLDAEAKAVAPARSDAMPHADLLKSYVGLLCLGKSDFEAVNGVREDDFFAESLGLSLVPSGGTLRQRMDAHAAEFLPVVQEAAIEFLRRTEARITPLDIGMVPLDADVTPFDNGQTKKEGVSRTYKGTDGYAPMAAYLGQEGYCLELELREGKQHCQKETPAFLERVLERARTLTASPILLRLDGGNDAIENIEVVFEHNERYLGAAPVHYLIKWNPRKEDPERWLTYAEEHGEWTEPRPGKRVALFEVRETRTHNGYAYPLRRVMRVVERTIDKHGQAVAGAGHRDGRLVDESGARPLADHSSVCRPRHLGAISQRVQNGPGHRAAAFRQVRHQCLGPGLCAAGLQYLTLDRPEWPVGTRRPASPQRQAAAHSYRDAGVDVPGGPTHP